REHVEEKLTKVTQFAPRAQRVDVELTQERNPRQAANRQRVELTVRDKGPVIRAEASAEDRIAAFELAMTKLVERLRRAHDRRRGNHHRTGSPVRGVVPADTADLPVATPPLDGELDGAADVQGAAEPAEVAPDGARESYLEDSPVVIREKTHQARPMTLDDALYEMELVGHDFYLFVDAETGQPSVVYRRRGWSYGVIRLDTTRAPEEGSGEEDLAEAATAGAAR